MNRNNEFNKRFDKQMDDFDKDFARAKKFGVVFAIGALIINGAIIGGVVWLIYVLLKHFSVI